MAIRVPSEENSAPARPKPLGGVIGLSSRVPVSIIKLLPGCPEISSSPFGLTNICDLGTVPQSAGRIQSSPLGRCGVKSRSIVLDVEAQAEHARGIIPCGHFGYTDKGVLARLQPGMATEPDAAGQAHFRLRRSPSQRACRSPRDPHTPAEQQGTGFTLLQDAIRMPETYALATSDGLGFRREGPVKRISQDDHCPGNLGRASQ